MIEYIRQTILKNGVPDGINFLFEEPSLAILTNFLRAECPDELFSSQIRQVLKGEETEIRCSGNGYSWTLTPSRTTIFDEEIRIGEACTVPTADLQQILEEWDRESSRYRAAEPFRIVPAEEVLRELQLRALNGRKIPHSMPRPVLRYSGGKWTIAAFVFFYTQEDIAAGKVRRPELWLEADTVSGEIKSRHFCETEDFSTAPPDAYYDITFTGSNDRRQTDEARMNAYFDSVRYDLASGRGLNFRLYRRYVELVLKYIPESYHRFFYELSNYSDIREAFEG